ncbi:divalent-cation tolerance protein CutA [Yinghuangia aomiensis]
MTDFVQVSTTAPSQSDAERLARSAVATRLAATAQVAGPLTSFFWHAGELGEGPEWAVWLKTTTDMYPALQAHIINEHPWDKPEVTATPIVLGSAPYLEWIRQATT